MNPKRIILVLRQTPSQNHVKITEALRMGVGLTLRDHEVYLIFLGDSLDIFEQELGVCGKEKGYKDHLKSFMEIGQTVVVEKEAMESRNRLIKSWSFRQWSREKIVQFILQCDGVIAV